MYICSLYIKLYKQNCFDLQITKHTAMMLIKRKTCTYIKIETAFLHINLDQTKFIIIGLLYLAGRRKADHVYSKKLWKMDKNS